MNGLCIDRDHKTIRLNDIVMIINKIAKSIMDLPRQLHQAGPIVDIRNGGIVYFGKTGGLGIEDEKHNQLKVEGLELRVGTVFVPTFGVQR